MFTSLCAQTVNVTQLVAKIPASFDNERASHWNENSNTRSRRRQYRRDDISDGCVLEFPTMEKRRSTNNNVPNQEFYRKKNVLLTFLLAMYAATTSFMYAITHRWMSQNAGRKINFLKKLRIIITKTRRNAAGNNGNIIRYCLGVIDFDAFLKSANHSIFHRQNCILCDNKQVCSVYCYMMHLSNYSFNFKSLYMLGI